MPPLSPIAQEDDWALEIAEEAKGEFWATIDIFIPGSKGTYNTATDKYEGGTPETVLISARLARAQHLRSPLESFGAYERSVRRAYRFQIIPEPGDPEVTDAARVRIIKAPRNPAIMAHVYSVQNTANSDHDAILTIECSSEFGVANG